MPPSSNRAAETASGAAGADPDDHSIPDSGSPGSPKSPGMMNGLEFKIELVLWMLFLRTTYTLVAHSEWNHDGAFTYATISTKKWVLILCPNLSIQYSKVFWVKWKVSLPLTGPVHPPTPRPVFRHGKEKKNWQTKWFFLMWFIDLVFDSFFSWSFSTISSLSSYRCKR